MSTETTKGHEAGEAAEAQDVATGEEERPAAKAPAKKKVRRVRVVEIIDDEDLDEVLDRLDAADAATEDTADEAKADTVGPDKVEPDKAKADKAKSDKAKSDKAKSDKAKSDKAKSGEVEDDEPRRTRVRTGRKTVVPAGSDDADDADGPDDPDDPGGLRRLTASPAVRAAAIVVVIAALATFGLVQWRQASDLSARQSARKAVEARLTEFGGVIGTYDTTRVKASQDKIASYMVGEALSVFQANTAKAQTLTDPAKAKVTTVSKSRQVIVGNVNGEFATGLIAVDITLTTEQGSAPMANNYLVVDLVKQKGVWKVSKLTPIGSPSDDTTPGGTGATAPGAGATPTAKPTK